MIHRVAYTIFTPTGGAAGRTDYVEEVEDTTWARAYGQVVLKLETELEAGDVWNYAVRGLLGGVTWGWEPDDEETICVL